MPFSKDLIISYFADLDMPLAEATRLQFFYNDMNSDAEKYAFVKNVGSKTRLSDGKVRVHWILALTYLLPIFIIRTHFFKKSTWVYGPNDSLLLNVMAKLLKAERIFTDGQDVHLALNDKNHKPFLYIGHPDSDSEVGKCIIPTLEEDWAQNYRTPFTNLDVISIGYMSHFSLGKGILDICQALQHLPESLQKKVTFHVASNSVSDDISVREAYDIFSNDFSGNIRTLGKVDPYLFMREMDIYIYPFHSKKNTFNVPFTLLEASLSGTFVVGPNLKNVRPWLTVDSLVEPRDPESLSTVIQMALYNKDRSIEIIKMNNKRILKSVRLIRENRL